MITAIITISLSLALSLFLTKKVLAPTTIVSALWLFCVIAYWIYPHGYSSLKDQFYIGISLWVGFFCFFALFRQSLSIKERHIGEPSALISNIYFIITLISFPLSVWGIFEIVQQYGLSKHLYASLRNIAVGNVKGLEDGLANNYFATLWLVAYAIELLHFKKTRLSRLLILFFINFSWAFMVMAKMNFLNLIFTTLAILFFKKIIKPKVIYVSMAVIFISFTFLQVTRTVGANKSSDLNYDFFSLYVMSSIPAFEKTKPASSEYFGQSTFRFFYKVGEKLGLTDKTAEDALQPFTNIGKQQATYTNVYTTLYPFYKDFGNWGIIIFGAFTGLFYGYLYKGLLKNNKPFIVIYAIFTSSLIIQFMSDNTLSKLSFVIQIFVLSHLPYWFGKNSYSNDTSNTSENNE